MSASTKNVLFVNRYPSPIVNDPTYLREGASCPIGGLIAARSECCESDILELKCSGTSRTRPQGYYSREGLLGILPAGPPPEHQLKGRSHRCYPPRVGGSDLPCSEFDAGIPGEGAKLLERTSSENSPRYLYIGNSTFNPRSRHSRTTSVRIFRSHVGQPALT